MTDTSFAQTDIDQRVHRNQTTNALGKMSFGILQTFLRRLGRFGRLPSMPDLETIYRQFEVEDRDYQQITHSIVEEESPPMIEIPAYRKKFGRK